MNLYCPICCELLIDNDRSEEGDWDNRDHQCPYCMAVIEVTYYLTTNSVVLDVDISEQQIAGPRPAGGEKNGGKDGREEAEREREEL